MDRADAFAAAVREGRTLSPSDEVLLEEACRLIRRSDRFERLLAGDLDSWATISWPYEDSPAELVVSSVVSEARSTVTELRQVVKVLTAPTAAATPEPESPAATAAPAGVVSMLDRGGKRGGKRVG